MASVVDIPSSPRPLPENDGFSLYEHLQFIRQLAEDSWKLVLRYENPAGLTKKTKHPPLEDLAEDDLRRKLVLNMTQKLSGTPAENCYVIAQEDDESGVKPDIVAHIKTTNMTDIIDVECKKSKNDSKSKKNYQEEGVKRFTDGAYDKSGTGLGGMIGFAVNTSTHPLGDIIELLRDASDFQRTSISPAVFDGANKFETTHDREDLGTGIKLLHLVLRTN